MYLHPGPTRTKAESMSKFTNDVIANTGPSLALELVSLSLSLG